eukprot:6201211-Pleurochrysis_carterae.AAC.4
MLQASKQKLFAKPLWLHTTAAIVRLYLLRVGSLPQILKHSQIVSLLTLHRPVSPSSPRTRVSISLAQLMLYGVIYFGVVAWFPATIISCLLARATYKSIQKVILQLWLCAPLFEDEPCGRTLSRAL